MMKTSRPRRTMTPTGADSEMLDMAIDNTMTTTTTIRTTTTTTRNGSSNSRVGAGAEMHLHGTVSARAGMIQVMRRVGCVAEFQWKSSACPMVRTFHDAKAHLRPVRVCSTPPCQRQLAARETRHKPTRQQASAIRRARSLGQN